MVMRMLLDGVVVVYKTVKKLEELSIDFVASDASSTTLWLGHVRENPTAGHPGSPITGRCSAAAANAVVYCPGRVNRCFLRVV